MEVAENVPEEGQQGFDLVVHKRHPKTGKTVSVNPYRLYSIQGTQYFERPKGSGNLFYKDGSEAGRMIEGKVDSKAEHIEWKVEPTQDELTAQSLAAKDQEIDRLKREVEAIKREKKLAAAGKQASSAKIETVLEGKEKK